MPRYDESTQTMSTGIFLVISAGINRALTVKADPRSESGFESDTGPDLSPAGGEPFRLAIGKSFSF